MARHSRNLALEQSWRSHLKRQASGGTTIRSYCREHGLQEASFHYWRRVIAERDRQSATSTAPTTPAFLPVAIIEPTAQPLNSPIDIRLADGRRVRVRPGCDRRLLADVLTITPAALRKSSKS